VLLQGRIILLKLNIAREYVFSFLELKNWVKELGFLVRAWRQRNASAS